MLPGCFASDLTSASSLTPTGSAVTLVDETSTVTVVSEAGAEEEAAWTGPEEEADPVEVLGHAVDSVHQ